MPIEPPAPTLEDLRARWYAYQCGDLAIYACAPDTADSVWIIDLESAAIFGPPEDHPRTHKADTLGEAVALAMAAIDAHEARWGISDV